MNLFSNFVKSVTDKVKGLKDDMTNQLKSEFDEDKAGDMGVDESDLSLKISKFLQTAKNTDELCMVSKRPEEDFLQIKVPETFEREFDIEKLAPTAERLLEIDDNLDEMRTRLVPVKIEDDVFWMRYFYLVSICVENENNGDNCKEDIDDLNEDNIESEPKAKEEEKEPQSNIENDEQTEKKEEEKEEEDEDIEIEIDIDLDDDDNEDTSI